MTLQRALIFLIIFLIIYIPHSQSLSTPSPSLPSLPNLFSPTTTTPSPSPQSYAYIGDVVYELLTRVTLLYPLRRTSDYHTMVVKKVRAEEQARVMKGIIDMNEGGGGGTWDFIPLEDDELGVVKRGRNSVKSQPSRFKGDKDVYQDATSLECLVGYMYLKDMEGVRFRSLGEYIKKEIVRDSEG